MKEFSPFIKKKMEDFNRPFQLLKCGDIPALFQCFVHIHTLSVVISRNVEMDKFYELNYL